MQRRRKFDESHTAAHSTEVAEKPRDLRVVTAHDTVQVDDEHAVLHILNDETIHLLQIGDVDAALSCQILGQLGVTAECHRDADGREIAKADESGLEQRRTARGVIDDAIRFQAQQYDSGECGMEKSRAGSLQPPARRELRKQQDRQRRAAGAGGNHHERKKEHVANQQRKQRLRKRHRQTLLLDPPVRGDAENEIQTGGGNERMRRRDT